MPDTLTVDLGGTARLWDEHFNLLATEPCATPGARLAVTVRGKGALYDAVKAAAVAGLIDKPLHLTFDQNLEPNAWRTRRGGRVTALEIDQHRCECGNDVITTTVRAAEPAQLPSAAWPIGPIEAEVRRAADRVMHNRRSGG